MYVCKTYVVLVSYFWMHLTTVNLQTRPVLKPFTLSCIHCMREYLSIAVNIYFFFVFFIHISFQFTWLLP